MSKDTHTPSKAILSQIDEAVTLRNNGREIDAIRQYEKLLQILEKQNFPILVATVAQEMGICYMVMNHAQEAIDWFKKSIAQYEALQDFVGVGNVQRDIGITYLNRNKYDKALEWFKKSEQTLESESDLNALGITRAKIAVALSVDSKYLEAESYLTQALNDIRADTHPSWFMEMTAILEFAKLKVKQDQYQESLSYAYQALGIITSFQAQEAQQRRVGEISMVIAWSLLNLDRAEASQQAFINAMSAWESMDADTTQMVIDSYEIRKYLDRLADIDEDLSVEAENNYENIL